MQLHNLIEAEALKKQRMELAIQEMRQARTKLAEEHEKQLAEITKVVQNSTAAAQTEAVDWLKKQFEQLRRDKEPTEEEEVRKKEEEEKKRVLAELEQQQKDIQEKIQSLTGTNKYKDEPDITSLLTKMGETQGNSQQLMMQQLKAALAGKQEDPEKALIRALVNPQNRVTTNMGANTLRPELLNRLTADNPTSMAEWLANLNKQEEGEYEAAQILAKQGELGDCGPGNECRHTKLRSGMLDKATAHVLQKQTWPQRNLGEDWVKEEVEYKHIRFEHLVAGKTQTIELCMDPAQILGRLRLLRCIAYLKLRGYEWHLLHKMYAAILRSIETGENSWESNFDWFETMLYRKIMADNKIQSGPRAEGGPRKRFCRDYNKPDGCPKQSPHPIWTGSGPHAAKKLVYHCCAPCLLRDKQFKEHPEGHPECPHRD